MGRKSAPPFSPRTQSTSCPVGKTRWSSFGRSPQAGLWSSTQVRKKQKGRKKLEPCVFIHLSFFLPGAGLSGRQMHRTQGVFNHTEDYVLLPDERTISLCCWDSRTAERKNLLSLGHNNIVRCIVHSPTNPGFMTCSDDFRARFWYRRTTTD